MVIESNILDFIFLKDGEQGEAGKPGESGKTLYTWIKYSQNADGYNMTDDPDGAIYVGFAYNKESVTESTDPSDYSWTKIKGEDGKQGEDAYTIILSNENISFATNQSNIPLSNQSIDCEVTIMKGSSIVTDFTIGVIESVSGINISVLGKTITLSVASSTAIENNSGSIAVPITVDGYTFNKIISYSISKSGVDGKTLYTWIRYADSPTSGISSSPDGKKYMGVAYNKTISEPSDTYSDYKWSLIEGDGIASVETERVKNTDKTTAPTSGWSTDNVTWESGSYIWTRLKITYKSGTIKYTEPQVSSEWEAANQVQDKLDKEIEKVNSTISGVSSKVDQNTKSITDKVWQTDITNSINNYDNTTAEAIRERVTKTETDISGIKSSVSDIKSDVEKKADGITVQTLSEKVSTMEQDAESFKTTVSETYATQETVNTLSSSIQQNANKIGMIVTDGEEEGSLVLTNSMLAAMVKQFIVTSPDGSATIISEGKITTDNIVGTNGWINLALGTFNYGNGALAWDGNKLTIGGSFKDEVLDEVTNGALTVLDDNLEVLTSDTVTVTSDSEELYANNIVSLVFAASDGSDGWVYYFNRRITIPKFEVNLSLSTFGNVTGFIVHRANGVNYVVWYENDTWYGKLADGTGSSFEWTWISATDIVLAEWTKKSAESIVYQVYSPAQSYEDIRKVAMLGNWAFGAISETTTINGGLIQTHSIITDKLATDAIKSLNYVYTSGTYSDSGSFFDLEKGSIISKNFAIDENGNAYFNGKIESVEGNIGGWNINTTSIYKGSSVFGTAGTGNMYFGNSGLSISDTFKVDSSGNLTCSGGTITGSTIQGSQIIINDNISSSDFSYDAANLKIINSNDTNKFVYLTSYGIKFNVPSIGYASYMADQIFMESPTDSNKYSMISYQGIATTGTLLVNGEVTVGSLAVTGDITANKISAGYMPPWGNSIGCSNWFRSSGDTGWYNATHDGGWYMSDSTWVRTWQEKSIYSGSGVIRADGGFQMNGQTSYNRISNDTSFSYNWRCTESGNFNPYTDVNTNSANTVNIGNTSSYIKNLYYGGTLSKQSDRRIKNPIGKLTEDEALVILCGSKIEKFTYKNDDLQRINYGVYAQDLRDLLIESGIGHISMLGIDIADSDGEQTKDLLMSEENVRYTVDYTQYAPLLVCGWQYHEDNIKDLKSRVEVLEEENKELKRRLNIA